MSVDSVDIGDQVILYSDNCQTQIADSTAIWTMTPVYWTNLNPGRHIFYAKRVSGGKSSPCILVVFEYTISDTVTIDSNQFINRIVDCLGFKTVTVNLCRVQKSDVTVYFNHIGSIATTNQVLADDGSVVILQHCA